jgi:uracil-DNA glycosylase family 4
MNEIRPNAKAFLILEAPSYDDREARRLCEGRAGKFLLDTFARHGLSREDLSIATMWDAELPGGKFEAVLKEPKLYASVRAIEESIERTKPNLVVLVGPMALKLFAGKTGITRYRGSVLPYGASKCIAILDPYAVIRSPVEGPVFDGDVRRAVQESAYPELRQLQREIKLPLGGLVASTYFDEILQADIVACDIESVRNSKQILCISFAVSPTLSYVFNWEDYAEREYAEKILTNPGIRKVFQYGCGFDINMLWENGADVQSYTDDTMVAQHILNPELPRGLDFLTSIYTDMPYYKQEGRGEIPDNIKAWSDKADRKGLYVYNGKDTLATFEIWQKQLVELEESGLLPIYRQEMELAQVGIEISRNGMLVDESLRERMAVSSAGKWANYQLVLDAICSGHVNVRSPKQIRTLLYDTFKLPPRRNRNGALATDEDAIVSLMGICADKINTLKTEESRAGWQLKLQALQLLLQIREVRQLTASYLLGPISPDGRIRSSYNVCATETGRWAASKYVDGSGLNSQTFPRGKLDVSDNADRTAQINSMLKDILDEHKENEDDN